LQHHAVGSGVAAAQNFWRNSHSNSAKGTAEAKAGIAA